jgi:BASS family bile acid:Na+ symporter
VSLSLVRAVPGQGANLLALSIFAGILVPPLAALLRPFLYPSIFFLILISLLQMDLPRVFGTLRADAVSLLSISVWQLLALPIAIALLHLHTPLGGSYTLTAFFTACAGSLFGSAAFARLMNLDEALTLKGTVVSVLLMPLTLPLLAAWVNGNADGFDVAAYGARLSLFLLLPLVIAFACHARPRVRERLQRVVVVRHGSLFFLCVFAIGIMDGIGSRIVAEPMAMTGLLLLAFAIHLGQFFVTALVFAGKGRRFALTAGLLSSYRNLGLLLAVAGSLLPPGFIVFVAVWQVPMYFMPLMMKRFNPVSAQ